MHLHVNIYTLISLPYTVYYSVVLLIIFINRYSLDFTKCMCFLSFLFHVDNAFISPELQKIFERVRDSADFMPRWQLEVKSCVYDSSVLTTIILLINIFCLSEN